MTKKWIILAFLLAGFVSIQGVIWGPEVAHYRVPNPLISQSVLDMAIRDPDNKYTSAIQSFDFSLAGDFSDIETLLVAEAILAGTLDFPGFETQELDWPFEKRHLLLDGPSFQLKMAGLAWAELALDAWALTGEIRFLDFAKENVLQFIRIEERQILPTGYLWNDHAIANRAIVYVQLWAALKSQNALERETASEILAAVERTASFLAKPSHYTFRTNHGVMQNSALIIIAAAFPWLDEAQSYMSTGYGRLGKQMDYFISDQGAVLENSAGYHEFGVAILRPCFALLQELSMPVPEAWQTKLQRAEEWLRVLARPDFSVPNFGDSDPRLGTPGREIVGMRIDGRRQTDKIDSRGGENGSFLMDAGIAVFRAGIGQATDSGIHLTMTWGNFDSGAHKHADELSVHYWSDGTAWWTSSGYWPYGVPHRNLAIGWGGSNAPHLVGEKANSVRSSSLVAVGNDGDHAVWVLGRQNNDGYDVLRHVVLFRDEWALVVDAVQDKKSRPTEFLWGVPTHITINRRGECSAELVHRETGRVLGVSFDAIAPVDLSLLHGSLEPFGGWLASRVSVRPSWAIRILSPANNGVATAWGKLPETGAANATDVKITDWHGQDQWSVELNVNGSEFNIQRAGSKFLFSDSASVGSELGLEEPDVDQYLAAETEAYKAEASKVQVYRDYFPWRLKVSQYGLYLFLGLALLVAFLPRNITALLFPYALSATAAAVLLLGAYLQFVYFVA